MKKTAIYMTEVVGLCNFYTFFASREEYNYARIEMLPWLLLSLLFFGCLHLFLQKERPLGQIIIVSIASYFITVVIMSLFFIHVTGIIAWMITWVFLGITIIRAAMIQLEDCDLKSVLVRCELPALGIAFLLCLNTSEIYYFPPYYMALTIAVFLFNLIALTITRMNSLGATASVSTTTLCILAVGVIATAIAYFTTTLAATVVAKTSAVISWLSNWIYTTIAQFFSWFFSLFPDVEYQAESMEAAQATSTEMAEMAEISSSNITAFLICITIAIVCFVLWLLYKFRKILFHKRTISRVYQRPQQVTEKIKFFSRIKTWLNHLFKKLQFELILISKQNTPEGSAIILSRIGKKRGVKKQEGESYHSYLNRLAPLCNQTVLLEKLANIIDDNLYATIKTSENLSAKEHRLLKKSINSIYHTKKWRKFD